MMSPLAVSIGEPGGVGPECIAGAWTALRHELAFALIADPTHLPVGLPHQVISDIAEAPSVMHEALPVLARPFGPPRSPGRAEPAHASAVIRAIEEGVRLAQSGAASGLVTLPINKAALARAAGFAYPGHTECLAALDGAPRAVMMIASPALRVVPVTIHIPLSDVPAALTRDALTETIRITHGALIRDFGVRDPILAVAGLNPHAGEDGRMGLEEQQLIAPVLEELRREGLRITGPLPADTMFHPAARARYDAAIAMYHDQALIPAKTLDFAGGVNVTLGLSFIRTSPDHGTAFDIAGTDRADPSSTIAAIRMAASMAKARGHVHD